MPRMTAPQLFWTGVGVLALGFLLGWAGTVFMFVDLYEHTWVFALSSALSGAFNIVGTATIGSGLVVGALQRRMSTAPQPGPGYGQPQPTAGPHGPYADTAQVPVVGQYGPAGTSGPATSTPPAPYPDAGRRR